MPTLHDEVLAASSPLPPAERQQSSSNNHKAMASVLQPLLVFGDVLDSFDDESPPLVLKAEDPDRFLQPAGSNTMHNQTISSITTSTTTAAAPVDGGYMQLGSSSYSISAATPDASRCVIFISSATYMFCFHILFCFFTLQQQRIRYRELQG